MATTTPRRRHGFGGARDLPLGGRDLRADLRPLQHVRQGRRPLHGVGPLRAPARRRAAGGAAAEPSVPVGVRDATRRVCATSRRARVEGPIDDMRVHACGRCGFHSLGRRPRAHRMAAPQHRRTRCRHPPRAPSRPRTASARVQRGPAFARHHRGRFAGLLVLFARWGRRRGRPRRTPRYIVLYKRSLAERHERDERPRAQGRLQERPPLVARRQGLHGPPFDPSGRGAEGRPAGRLGHRRPHDPGARHRAARRGRDRPVRHQPHRGRDRRHQPGDPDRRRRRHRLRHRPRPTRTSTPSRARTASPRPRARQDDNGHGTHVAGTIAAGNGGSGVVGVAPGTKLYSVKVLGATGTGTVSSLICGIDWVAANAKAENIQVANMSVGSAGPSRPRARRRPTPSTPRSAARWRRRHDGRLGRQLRRRVRRRPGHGPRRVPRGPRRHGDDRQRRPARRRRRPARVPRVEGDDTVAKLLELAATSVGAAHTIAAPGTCITSDLTRRRHRRPVGHEHGRAARRRLGGALPRQRREPRPVRGDDAGRRSSSACAPTPPRTRPRSRPSASSAISRRRPSAASTARWCGTDGCPRRLRRPPRIRRRPTRPRPIRRCRWTLRRRRLIPTAPAPDPTTPAPDPSTPAPDPSTPAPDPSTPAGIRRRLPRTRRRRPRIRARLRPPARRLPRRSRSDAGPDARSRPEPPPLRLTRRPGRPRARRVPPLP